MAAAILCAFLTNGHRWLGINDQFASPGGSENFSPMCLASAQARFGHGQMRKFTWGSGSAPPLF